MATWVNNGSYQDLSDLLPGGKVSVLAPTSQAGGNMTSSNEQAMTAPGSQPVDKLVDRAVQSDPTIEVSGPELPPGEDGKPQPKTTWSPPGEPSWKPTTVPDVVRQPDRRP